jgi:PleD family two-component response regulator
MSVRRLETGLRQIAAGLVALNEPTVANLEQLAKDLRSIRLDAIQFGYADVVTAVTNAEKATPSLLAGKSDAHLPCVHAIHDLGQVLLLRLRSAAEQPRHEAANKDATRPRLLVVDDSRVAAMALANAFVQQGFNVRSVATMEEAIAELKALRPCILVSDVYMPDLDLSRLCRLFRAQSEGHCGLIVLVSGSSGETLNVLLDSVRPDAFVTKLSGTGQVVDRVLELWNKRQKNTTCPVGALTPPCGDSAPSCDSNPKGAR